AIEKIAAGDAGHEKRLAVIARSEATKQSRASRAAPGLLPRRFAAPRNDDLSGLLRSEKPTYPGRNFGRRRGYVPPDPPPHPDRRTGARGLSRRPGADALRRRLWRLVRADHPQGDHPGVHQEIRRDG